MGDPIDQRILDDASEDAREAGPDAL